MGALEEFDAVVQGTEVIRRVLHSLTIEAAQALRQVCRESEQTGKPLPDYRLSTGGYMGEMIVRALIEASLMEEVLADRRAVRQYQPTERGLAFYHKFAEEQSFARKS
ncbi:MAG: hypothetical protein HY688_03760 [Chloroflexi bacterium]|nr:hypothetical protein [Chloroflexota bacterium]